MKKYICSDKKCKKKILSSEKISGFNCCICRNGTLSILEHNPNIKLMDMIVKIQFALLILQIVIVLWMVFK